MNLLELKPIFNLSPACLDSSLSSQLIELLPSKEIVVRIIKLF
jgi:hypothetical protein